MKKGVILKVLAIAIILGLIALFTGFNMSIFKKFKLPDLNKECYKDSDCVKVQTTCCSCSSGGEDKCVSKTEAASYEDELKNCSADNFCAQVYNCNISECKCKEGRCAG
ncbi:MAG: hypothetical protein KKE50_00855 [Nanoarchaeota archaeon]|nr:hypothetical protein [Nanoarchaeota archaeon]